MAVPRSNMIISHRGNLSGPNPETENTFAQIESVLDTTIFDVEIDVRYFHDKLYLGHDKADLENPISISFLLKHKNRLWVHCKNLEARSFLNRYKSFGAFSINFFFHDKDPYVLTSNGWLWGFPEVHDIDHYVHNIHILENENNKNDFISYQHICSDYPLRYE